MFRLQLILGKVILFCILLTFIAGCQPVSNETMRSVTVTGTQIPRQAETAPSDLSPTPSHNVSQTPSLTLTSEPLSTDFPVLESSSTPFLIETVTLTPLPTLPPIEADNKMVSLLEDNQNPNCLLPCWWGAIPGQTHWSDVEPFLKTFAEEIYYSSSTTSFGAEVHLPLPERVQGTDSDTFRIFYGWSESGIIHGIAVDPINISGYDPVTMMTLYGMPDEVWLSTMREPREGILPFQLIIAYQRKGISFRYYVDAARNGDFVTACFEPNLVETERPELFPASPRIYLWEPGQTKSIEEISPIPLEEYFPLETKSTLTPETFYQRFIDPNQQPCIDTPSGQW